MFKKFLSIFTVMAVVSSVVLGSYSEVSAKSLVLRAPYTYLNLGICKGSGSDSFILKYTAKMQNGSSYSYSDKGVVVSCPAGERYGIRLDSFGNATLMVREDSGANLISQSRACPIGKIGTYGKTSVTNKLNKYSVDTRDLTQAKCYYGGVTNANKAKSVKVIKIGSICKAVCI